MRIVLVGLALLVVLVSVSACTSEESCDGHVDDRCEGDVAVTCRVPTSNGSGYGILGGYHVDRMHCTSGVCGRSCECFKPCDICERKLIETVACDPDPGSCDQSCN